MNAKERANAIAKEFGAVFIIGIGGVLSNGQVHDLRAPDYDDWTTACQKGLHGLNGDIVVWNPTLQHAFELSSMGIRVTADILRKQLALTHCLDRLELTWHRLLLSGQFPQTIGDVIVATIPYWQSAIWGVGGQGKNRIGIIITNCQS